MTRPRAHAHTWVIGGSGLLGSALLRWAPRAQQFVAPPIPWREPERAVAALGAALEDFRRQVGARDEWAIYWAAGASTIGTDQALLARERSTLLAFFDALSARPPTGNGAVFFASSASVYAGTRPAPFSESSPPRPLNAYAEAKLALESGIAERLEGRIPHVLGRISTLYGPGQDLTKGQGLVSTLCAQAVQRRTVSVFVPLDTLRDYLYVDDAAAMITALTACARDAHDCRTRIRNVCHGSATTIGMVAATVRAVNRRRIHLTQSPRWDPRTHVHDLRVRTEYAAEISGIRRTPMPAGISNVLRDVERQLEARGDNRGSA